MLAHTRRSEALHVAQDQHDSIVDDFVDIHATIPYLSNFRLRHRQSRRTLCLYHTAACISHCSQLTPDPLALPDEA
jgi:hypothetical protein